MLEESASASIETVTPTTESTDDNDETFVTWEYEPRIWSPDELDSDSTMEFQEDSDQSKEDEATGGEATVNSNENIRKQSNFLSQNIQPKQRLTSRAEDDCTQFRLDTREAVVCDKKRCDKFDFEWPTYDDQIAWIQTTKHGMRFHRADLAFAPKVRRVSFTKEHAKVSERGKVPFEEIINFFKPKPSTTTTTTTSTTKAPASSTTTATTTATPTTTTSAPSSSTPGATTSEPPPQPTSEQSDEPTTDPIIPVQPTTARPIRDIIDNSQDSNTTQLVTTFRLDTGRRMQKMIGFGGALTDSTCRNIKSLSPQMGRSLMDDYYSERGLKYNIVRMTIGSSDFSTSPYTNNDLNSQKYFANNSITRMMAMGDELGDVEMKNFHLTEEDYEFKLPVARQAIATSKQELKFLASMWSPPVWMKENGHIIHGRLKGDVYGPYYKGLAELIVRWLEAYRKSGIDFWGTTGLNEPITGKMPFIQHNSLEISRDDYVTFFKLYLGPMLRQRGFGAIKIIMHDDNKGFVPNWVNAMLGDPEAAKYISGIGIHWYMNDDYENLDFLPKKFPDKFILSTEACNGFLGFQTHVLPGNWDRGVAYMIDMIKIIQRNAAGWVDWNMALDLSGGPSWAKNFIDSAVIVNARRDEYYKSPTFYAMGHFSKFVEPNSVRLDYRIANARYDYPLEAVAFLTPKNYIVIVAMNSNRHQVPFKVIVDRQVVRIVNLRAESFNTLVFKWKPK